MSNPDRWRRIGGLLEAAVVLSMAPPAVSVERAGPGVEVTPRLEAAIQKGLAWLASRQYPDGAFGSRYGKHVGVTGLACLAFMADGHLPGRGRYGAVVQRGLDFVLAHQDSSGLLAAETSHGPMYGHALATLFLAEIYGSAGRGEVREALERAVRLIEATQNDQGGWRYQPVRADADITVTVCQVMALRAARDAGIGVGAGTIERAVQYILRSQNPDGGFRYRLSSGSSAFARSAAAVAGLYYGGIYRGAAIERGLAYLMRYVPGQAEPQGHYFYGHYCAVQAMFQAGGRWWRRWWPAIRDELLERQEPAGCWGGLASREYGTAMALIILQVPKRLLPMLQR
ncbi:MAG: prenyltransferase/squalene oxidase repeat-containing protein [Phycisphaerae bacterium]